MKTVICQQCNTVFSSEEDFETHKQSGHQTPGTPIDVPPPVLAPGTTPEEFAAQVARIEAKKRQPSTLIPMPTTAPATPQEVKLTYKYVGTCPTCNELVKTLEMDLNSKHFVVAFCVKEDKQLESREVIKLYKEEVAKKD